MPYAFLILAYLLGAVPFGLLLAKARGVDIRATGSGNIGATNVYRTLGKGAGLTVFALDALKGFVPAFCFPCLAGACDSLWGLGFGLAAIAGHNWPVYLKFKGGKGVATSAGVIFGVAPLAAVVGLAVWAAVFLASGYVSLGSVCAGVAVPAAAWLLYRSPSPVLPAVLTLLGLLVVWRHRTNLQRLAAGTESRFNVWRKKS